MRRSGTRLRATIVLAMALTAAATGMLAVPAGAAAGPAWPPGGYQPTCDAKQALSGGRTRYQDTTAPAVGTVTFTKGRTQVAARPGGTTVGFEARLTDPCSGVDEAVLDEYHGASYVRAVHLVPNVVGGRAFDVVGSSDVTTFQVREIGRYTFQGGISRQRYSSFVLDSGNHLVSSVAQQTWSLVTNPSQTLLVLKGTRLVSASARKATGAHRFRLSVSAQVATDKAWVPLSGAKVQLRRKNSAGDWVLVRRIATSAQGTVSTVVNASKRTAFRFEIVQQTQRLRAGSRSRGLRVG